LRKHCGGWCWVCFRCRLRTAREVTRRRGRSGKWEYSRCERCGMPHGWSVSRYCKGCTMRHEGNLHRPKRREFSRWLQQVRGIDVLSRFSWEAFEAGVEAAITERYGNWSRRTFGNFTSELKRWLQDEGTPFSRFLACWLSIPWGPAPIYAGQR
jgi:hypothetical protein